MHGRLLVKWLGFVNSCGRSCFLEEIAIVVPRWFCRASRYRFFNSILDATDRSWDNSFTDSVRFVSSVMRSCPHAHALPVNWSSPKMSAS